VVARVVRAETVYSLKSPWRPTLATVYAFIFIWFKWGALDADEVSGLGRRHNDTFLAGLCSLSSRLCKCFCVTHFKGAAIDGPCFSSLQRCVAHIHASGGGGHCRFHHPNLPHKSL
jgi:hypothetical protein